MELNLEHLKKRLKEYQQAREQALASVDAHYKGAMQSIEQLIAELEENKKENPPAKGKDGANK